MSEVGEFCLACADHLLSELKQYFPKIYLPAQVSFQQTG